jgi:hypothetical protein
MSERIIVATFDDTNAAYEAVRAMKDLKQEQGSPPPRDDRWHRDRSADWIAGRRTRRGSRSSLGCDHRPRRRRGDGRGR